MTATGTLVQPPGLSIHAHRIFDEYPIPYEASLDTVSSTITKYLKQNGEHEIDSEIFEQMLKTVEVAVKQFDDLTVEMQEKIFELQKNLLKVATCDSYINILTDPEKKGHYTRLTEIFIGHLYNKKVFTLTDEWVVLSGSPTTPRHVANESSKLVPLDKEEEFFSERQEQIQKITHFIQMLIRDYLGGLTGPKNGNNPPLFEEDFNKKFATLFPRVIPHLFFGPHGELTTMQQSLLHYSMVGLHEFLQNYNNAERALKSSKKVFSNKNFEEREQKLAALLYKNIHGVKHHQKDVDQVNDEKVLIHINELLQKIIERLMDSNSPKEEFLNSYNFDFLLFFVSSMVTHITFKHVLSPHLFCIIINNLLLSKVDIDLDDIEETDSKQCHTVNKKFQTALGNEADKLCSELFTLGEAQGLLKQIPSGVTKFKNLIGEAIETEINKTLNTECLLKTILVVKETLYQGESPVMRDAMNMSEEEVQKYKSDVEKHLENRLYEIIKANIPESLRMLTDRFSSLKGFCSTLSRKLFEISQSPVLYTVLFYHILKAIHQGLSEAERIDA